jgi:hypothetical protein
VPSAVRGRQTAIAGAGGPQAPQRSDAGHAILEIAGIVLAVVAAMADAAQAYWQWWLVGSTLETLSMTALRSRLLHRPAVASKARLAGVMP